MNGPSERHTFDLHGVTSSLLRDDRALQAQVSRPLGLLEIRGHVYGEFGQQTGPAESRGKS